MDLIEIRGKNFCCYPEFNLPLYKQGLVWVTGENLDTESANNNGSGKSTLFKALTWCLYGQTIDKEKGDKVIRKGTKHACVEIVLSDGKNNWTVKRQRRKGAPDLVLIKPDGSLVVASKEDIQTQINNLLGLDFHAFKNTVLYGQNDSSRFTNPSTRDSDRKEMLHRILRTEILKKCHEWIKEQSKKFVSEKTDLDKAIEGLEIRIDEQNIEELENRYSEFETERENNISEYEDKIEKCKEQAKRFLELVKEVEPEKIDTEELRNTQTELINEMDSLGDFSKEADDLEEKLEFLESGFSELADKLYQSKANLKTVEDKLEKLNEDKCPLCTSPLDKGAAGLHVKGLREERKKVEEQFENDNKAYKILENKIAKIEDKKRHVLKKQKLARELSEKINKLEREIMDIERTNMEAESHKDILKNDAKNWIEKGREYISLLEKEKALKNPFENSIEIAKKKIKGYKIILKKNRNKLKEIEDDLSYIEFWIKGFSNQGLPSFILDSVMPFLSERANHYLKTLADGDIKMNFETQREKKSDKGAFRDEINITWEIEGVEDSYPPSGGQLKKMEIATDLALMDLVAAREGNHVNILALDEVLDGLDDEGCQRVLMLLQELRKKRDSIFVISHQSEVSEIFEHAVTAVKEGGETRLEFET